MKNGIPIEPDGRRIIQNQNELIIQNLNENIDSGQYFCKKRIWNKQDRIDEIQIGNLIHLQG